MNMSKKKKSYSYSLFKWLFSVITKQVSYTFKNNFWFYFVHTLGDFAAALMLGKTFTLENFWRFLLFSFIAFTAHSRYVNTQLQYFLKDYSTDLYLIPLLMVSTLIDQMYLGEKSQLQAFK